MSAASWGEFSAGDRVVVRSRLGSGEIAGHRRDGIASDARSDGTLVDQARNDERVVGGASVPPGGAKKYSDVIGIVVDVAEDGLKLRRDAAGYPDSNEVFVPASDIVTAKKVPPRPIRK
ncbi:MAG: hypothetical protein FWG25_10260 [Promicromonosporaceae bacterium]|nr:hypothetical protein [Promicromonosporaceae bacterium]